MWGREALFSERDTISSSLSSTRSSLDEEEEDESFVFFLIFGVRNLKESRDENKTMVLQRW